MPTLFESLDQLKSMFYKAPIPKTQSIYDTDEGMIDPWFSYLKQQQELPWNRRMRYRDYDDMDTDTWIQSALDIYAEEATQHNREHGGTVWIKATDSALHDEWKRFWEEIVKGEDVILAVARDLAKYGDDFQKLLWDPATVDEKGLLGIQFIDPYMAERDQDEFGRLTGYRTLAPTELGMAEQSFMLKPEDRPGKRWKPWEIIQFRVMGRKDMRRYEGGKYGLAVIEGARKSWKHLQLLEDSIMIYRLHRAPGARIFYIDVGEMGYSEALQVAKLYRQKYNLRRYANPRTGEYVQRHSPMAFNEDIFWPIRKDSNSRIEILGGQVDVTGIADLEYFRQKLFAALKVPKAYMGMEEGINAKATLAQMDVRFARSIKRLQRALLQGYTDLFRMHLKLMLPDDMAQPDGSKTKRDKSSSRKVQELYEERETEVAGMQYELQMSVVSVLEEQEKLEAMGISLDLADRLMITGATLGLDRGALAEYILVNVLLIPKDELDELGFDPEIARAAPMPMPAMPGAGPGGPGAGAGGPAGPGGPMDPYAAPPSTKPKEAIDAALTELLKDSGLRAEVQRIMEKVGEID